MTTRNATNIDTPAPQNGHTMTPEQYREHFGADETGEATYTFRGSIEIEDRHGLRTYARTVSFTITHHVDRAYDKVRWNVEHPDRRADALFTPDTTLTRPGSTIDAVLSTLDSYMREQDARFEKSRG